MTDGMRTAARHRIRKTLGDRRGPVPLGARRARTPAPFDAGRLKEMGRTTR